MSEPHKPVKKLPKGVNAEPNNLPDCDCGYSRSDWMPHHADYCAYLLHGKFHKLEVAVYSISLPLIEKAK